LKLYDKSNQANISGQGIHPVLANIETAGKLSSGSEIRNALIMYITIKAPNPRAILLKPFELVKKLDKWDADIFLGFKDVEMTTLDENPKGSQDASINE
ncbi:MAG: hypothetical protein ABIV51_12450, partial [Saprospiraceae bacterium]